MTHDEALADLKSKVSAFMDTAKILAMEKIDRLQASGVDIVGDHIKATEANGPWLIPRDFIAAFADEMKAEIGWISPGETERKRRIKNYGRLM